MSVAGAMIARKAMGAKRHKVFGVPVTRSKLHVPRPRNGLALNSLAQHLPNDIDSVANGVAKAGRRVGRTGNQLGRIATDIQRAGETTERVGKLLAK